MVLHLLIYTGYIALKKDFVDVLKCAPNPKPLMGISY